ncbi:ribonuclease P protein component [Carboxylicivirga sp. A043]|uniref:ribonuclease P protein component n=1 Tax=Carboxylicivirga litoralis TaxID=2816963 RepID=UPI0021CB597A|nr:ribonuclease P protein component [Carboxylicivirga sp. A043]MCU4155948.1 ribonuclease P protein component [Carboxylicivirga sp. A043]
MEQQRFTFNKNERLCSRTTIQELFTKGKSFVKYPFRVSFMPISPEEQGNAQILVSVSKKRFKRAYKRNRLKRLTREAYRLNKASFIAALHEKDVKLAVAFIYLPTDMLDYASVEKGMKKALKKVINDLSNEG